MRDFLNHQQVNFEPPSDFVGESSSSGGRRWLKWAGIGCAAMMLILAVLLAVGGFRMVSCCSGLIETGRLTFEVESFSQDFARSIQTGAYDAAYEMTSAEVYRSQTSPTEFAAIFRPHQELLARSVPVVSNLKVLGENEIPAHRWEVTMRLLPPDGTQVLTMMLTVHGESVGKDEPGVFEIVDLQLEKRTRDLALEPPVQGVRAIQNLLRVGDYEGAYGQLALGELRNATEEANGQGEANFRAFVRENQDVLTAAEAEVVRVEYLSSNEARVTTRARLSAEKTALVHYTMVRLSTHDGWQVSAISPEPVVEEPSQENVLEGAEPPVERNESGEAAE